MTQCAFPIMESEAVLNVNISKIYQKNQKKYRLLVMMLHGVFRVYCTFPYMEVLNRKTAKIYRKKNQKKMEIVGDDIRSYSQGPLYISIYRR